MFEIKLTIEIPDLLKAVQLLKAAETPVAPYTAPAMPLPDPTPVTPTVTRPVTQQTVSATTTAPVPPAPVTAPTAAPSFTIAQVSRAGAMLLTAKPELQGELMGLLGRFGAKTAQELPQDRLGEFAAELRRMGANI